MSRVGVGGNRKNRKAMKKKNRINRNGTEKRMWMMTKIRMEKTKQGRNNEKGRIIVSGVPMEKHEVAKDVMILRMMMVRHIENGNEE